MCGICGFTQADDASLPTLKTMCDVMAHRGPDGEGQYIDAESGIALGHRRLSLIDLANGNQPMVRSTGDHAATITSPALRLDGTPCGTPEQAAAKGRFAIVFNGEIYNYRDLRAELEARGLAVPNQLRHRSPAHRLSGMGRRPCSTACAACSRSPSGTAIRANCSAPATSSASSRSTTRSQNRPAVHLRFRDQVHPRASGLHARAQPRKRSSSTCASSSAPLPETFFKGIFKLAPAHCMTVHADGSITERRYWRPDVQLRCAAQPSRIPSRPSTKPVRDSVRYHNVADVEVGSFLSSGIDSSYMAACLAKENPDIKTFTVGFDCYKNAAANNAEGAGGMMRDEISWAHELADELHIANDSTSTSARTSTGRACLVCSGTWTSRPPTPPPWHCTSWTRSAANAGQGGAFRRGRRRVLRRLPHLPDAVRQRRSCPGPRRACCAAPRRRHAQAGRPRRELPGARQRNPRGLVLHQRQRRRLHRRRSAPSLLRGGVQRRAHRPQQLTAPAYAEVARTSTTPRACSTWTCTSGWSATSC